MKCSNDKAAHLAMGLCDPDFESHEILANHEAIGQPMAWEAHSHDILRPLLTFSQAIWTNRFRLE